MKKTINDNYRLEVTPETPNLRASVLLDHRKMLDLLGDTERAIRRHVDGIGQVVYRFDTRDECSHCGGVWTEITQEMVDQEHPWISEFEEDVDGPGLPVCCTEAQKEWRDERYCGRIAVYGNRETPDEHCDLPKVNGEDLCSVHREQETREDQLIDRIIRASGA